jgi:molybdopterin molybdotransferase
VLSRGQFLNGSRIGALAELGRALVPVRRRPRVAILATGDELVPIEHTPGPGQIRNSNEAMLCAQIEAAGGIPVPLGIARDDRDDLREKIMPGLQCDVLVISGGVSAGTLDLVPAQLAAAGVSEVFHKVEMKPGKPIWFGVRTVESQSSAENVALDPCFVFGLPGNPVSSLVCCELFVRTALRQLMGVTPATPQPIRAELEHEYSTREDRPTYHPAKLTWTRTGLAVTLVPWHGSSDLCGTVMANGMAFFPGEARQFRIGDTIDTFAWQDNRFP